MEEKKESIFKKLLYTGVGIAAITRERVEETVNELIRDKKITTTEGKKIVDDFIKEMGEKKGDIESQMKNFVEKATHKFKYAKKDDIKDLMERVEELESYVAKK